MSEPSYIARYNKTAAASGTSCAAEAIGELNDSLKHPVTSALQKVMLARPDDPIRYVASCLKQYNEAKYVTDRKSIALEDPPGLQVHMERASQRPAGCAVQRLPRYNLVGMQCPSFHELQQEIDNIIAEQPDANGILVIVKENDPRKDLVFVQGIPYFADLSKQLHEQRSTLKKKDSPQSVLLRAAGKTGRTHSLQDVISVGKTSKKPVRYVFIPSPLLHPLQAIDVIDNAVGIPGRDAATPPKLSPVIIVSYHPDASVARQLLTIAATAAQPVAELDDIKAIVDLRKASLAKRQGQNYSAHLEYWKQVRIRREARDQKREDREELRLRKEQTMLTAVASQTIDSQTVDKLHAESSLAVERNKKAAAARYNRRQHEDGAFLDVCRWHREQSATRIQAMFRGAKARAAWKNAAKENHRPSKIKYETRHKQLTNIDAPVLLQRALRYLQDAHGEQYVNSIELEKRGFVRTLHLWVPKKTRVHRQIDDEGADSSEEESWEEVDVELPTIPSAARTKSFNPFLTFKTAASHAGYDALENAIFDSVHFPGFSNVQHRAYGAVADAVILMVHAAFVELRHRNQATNFASFSAYLQNYFSEILAWRNVPNYVAQSTAQLLGVALREGPLDALQDRFLCMSDAPERPPWGHASSKNTEHSQWFKELASEVFAVLDASDATRWKGIVLSLSAGGKRPITWISTTPYPYAYVHGKTFVALERRRDQITPDHPIPNPLADVAKRTTLTPSVDISVDGRSRSPSLGMPSAPQSPMPTPRISDQGSFLPFGVSMPEFESKLRLDLIQATESEGVLAYLTIPEGSRTQEVSDLLSNSIYYAPYFPDCIAATCLVRKEYTPFPKQGSKNENGEASINDASGKEIRRSSGHGAAGMGNSNSVSANANNTKSGRYRRSHSRSGATGSGEHHSSSAAGSKSEGGLDLPLRSPGSISLSHVDTHAAITTASHAIIATPSATIDNIFNEDPFVDGEFVRMPMMDVGGQTWLGFLDCFLTRCFKALKSKRAVAIGVYDSPSMFYACCAALLSTPIEPKKGDDDPESPLFRSDNHALDEDLAHDFTVKLGGDTALRAKALVDDLLTGDYSFTKAVRIFKTAAESGTSHAQVRDNIVLATQRIERYCWLILLSHFLLTTSLAGVSELPSFANWALSKRNAGALEYLVAIDPWEQDPKKSPDPNHVAYSNIYKRWESKADAKQMV